VTTRIIFWAGLCLTCDKRVYLGSPTGNRRDMVTHSFSSLNQTLGKCSITGKFRKIYEQSLNVHIYIYIYTYIWQNLYKDLEYFWQSTKFNNKFSLKFLVIIAVMTQLVKKKTYNAQVGFNKFSSLLVHDKKWRYQHAKARKNYVDETQFRDPCA
jgi:hypothetical protein